MAEAGHHGPILTALRMVRSDQSRSLSASEEVVETWEDLAGLFPDIGDSRHRRWAFRGQRRDWDLATTLDRAPPSQNEGNRILVQEGGLIDDTCSAAEPRLLGQFQQRARGPLAAAQVQPVTRLEWLAWMQHFGVPTRLLDFTYSPHVAVYFALAGNTEERPDGSPTVHAVDMVEFRASARRKDDRIPPGNEPLGDTADDHKQTLEQVLLKNQVELVLPVAPTCMPARMRAQEGVFLCAGNTDRSFLENLNEMDCANEETVRKFILRFGPEERAAAVRRLAGMGITRHQLFPRYPELESAANAVEAIDSRHVLAETRDHVEASDSVLITMWMGAASKPE